MLRAMQAQAAATCMHPARAKSLPAPNERRPKNLEAKLHPQPPVQGWGACPATSLLFSFDDDSFRANQSSSFWGSTVSPSLHGVSCLSLKAPSGPNHSVSCQIRHFSVCRNHSRDGTQPAPKPKGLWVPSIWPWSSCWVTGSKQHRHLAEPGPGSQRVRAAAGGSSQSTDSTCSWRTTAFH